jgi:hypothetical protein
MLKLRWKGKEWAGPAWRQLAAEVMVEARPRTSSLIPFQLNLSVFEVYTCVYSSGCKGILAQIEVRRGVRGVI